MSTTFKKQLSDLINRVHDLITSTRGREILLFLVFLLISYIFWLLLTLNNEVQEDLEVPITLTNVPDSVTLISDVPPSLKVSVRDKGSSLVRYSWGEVPTMKINWDNYRHSSGKFLLGTADLNARLRDYFGANSQIVTITPDSMRINYTTSPGRRVAVKVNADVHPALGWTVFGPVTANVDSVWLYSVDDLPHSLNSVETVPIVRSGLKDTTKFDARIEPIPGVRIIPDRIILTVPVEHLIARKQYVSVIGKNVPNDYTLITFPSKVEVSYLVPMSEFNSEPYVLKAYVDYNEARHARNGKLKVTMSLMPELYRNASMTPDSVEYIIEPKRAQ